MNNTLTRWILCAALALAVLASPARAWGPEGHEIVADIAEHYLTPVAREKVKDLLGSKKLGDVEISSWPDIIRGTKEYEATYPGNGRWHYVDFNVSQRYDDNFELKLPGDGQDIVTQIGRWRDELAAPKASRKRKLDALRFLVHFAADLHQPLHCAYRYGDMGGNMIPVNSFSGRHYSFGPTTPMDYAPSIHSVWDEAMVNELMAGRRVRTVVRELRKDIAPDQMARWIKDPVFDWAVDSYWRARKEVYRWPNGESVPWKWARPGMDLTSENYIDARLPLVRGQLQKAGVRLANLLNSALDPAYVPPTAPAPEPAETAK
ncbi:MAG: hypothetical protein KBC66_06115 [Kiritimatiellae bacterium]|nr:hypothetical protein [Kiritimatiellia bacterium]